MIYSVLILSTCILYSQAWIRSQEAPFWGCRFTGTDKDTYSKDNPLVQLKPELCSTMDNDSKKFDFELLLLDVARSQYKRLVSLER